MIVDTAASSSTSYPNDYRVSNFYYNTAYSYEPSDKIIIKSKKEKVHIFDIKDLDLKEEG